MGVVWCQVRTKAEKRRSHTEGSSGGLRDRLWCRGLRLSGGGVARRCTKPQQMRGARACRSSSHTIELEREASKRSQDQHSDSSAGHPVRTICQQAHTQQRSQEGVVGVQRSEEDTKHLFPHQSNVLRGGSGVDGGQRPQCRGCWPCLCQTSPCAQIRYPAICRWWSCKGSGTVLTAKQTNKKRKTTTRAHVHFCGSQAHRSDLGLTRITDIVVSMYMVQLVSVFELM